MLSPSSSSGSSAGLEALMSALGKLLNGDVTFGGSGANGLGAGGGVGVDPIGGKGGSGGRTVPVETALSASFSVTSGASAGFSSIIGLGAGGKGGSGGSGGNGFGAIGAGGGVGFELNDGGGGKGDDGFGAGTSTFSPLLFIKLLR